MSNSEDFVVDNPGAVAVTADPASGNAGNIVEGGSPPAPENNYDPLIATRADRVAALTQRLLGADAPTATPEPDPSVEPGPAPVEPEPEPAPTEPQVDVPDKFKMADGSINPAFVKSYLSMESMYGRQAQQVSELTQAVMSLQSQLLAREPQAPLEPQAAPAPTPEELADANEKWLEKFYENPQAALGEAIASTIQAKLDPVLEPLVQDRQFQQSVQAYSQQVAALTQKYPDLDEYRPVMQEILNESATDPSSSLNLEAILSQDGAMEAIYLMAKGRAVQPAPPPVSKTPEELLKDQAFLAQVANNPEVQKMILANIQSQVRGEPKPPVVGARAGGTTPGLEPVSIKTTKDAARASVSYFQKAFGGTP